MSRGIAIPSRGVMGASSPQQRNLFDTGFKPVESVIPPDWLSHGAKVIWESILPQLIGQGIIKSTDIAIFAMWAQQYDTYIQLQESVNARGAIFVDNHGNPKLHPAIKQMGSMTHSIQALGIRLGLDPTSRQFFINSSSGGDNAFLKMMDILNENGV